jgi:hypothetical protein
MHTAALISIIPPVTEKDETKIALQQGHDSCVGDPGAEGATDICQIRLRLNKER